MTICKETDCRFNQNENCEFSYCNRDKCVKLQDLDECIKLQKVIRTSLQETMKELFSGLQPESEIVNREDD